MGRRCFETFETFLVRKKLKIKIRRFPKNFVCRVEFRIDTRTCITGSRPYDIFPIFRIFTIYIFSAFPRFFKDSFTKE